MPRVFAQTSGLALTRSRAKRSLFGLGSLKLWTAAVQYGFAEALPGKGLRAGAGAASSQGASDARPALTSEQRLGPLVAQRRS
jgi:hypothetical protein